MKNTIITFLNYLHVDPLPVRDQIKAYIRGEGGILGAKQHRKNFRNSLIYVCILDTRGRATVEGLTRIIPLACGAHTRANLSTSLTRKIRFAIILDRFRASAFSRRHGMRIALPRISRHIAIARDTYYRAPRERPTSLLSSNQRRRDRFNLEARREENECAS